MDNITIHNADGTVAHIDEAAWAQAVQEREQAEAALDASIQVSSEIQILG